MPSAFFIYAGHFLFASTLLHLVAPHLPFAHGKLTVLCLIFVGLGIPVCVLAHWIGRRVLSKSLTQHFDAGASLRG